MSVFEAVIVDTEATASVVQCVRRINPLSIKEVRRRISARQSVATWDSDEFALVGDRQTIHDKILADIATLRSVGCTLTFVYRPTIGDLAESVTYDQILDFMHADIEFDDSDQT